MQQLAPIGQKQYENFVKDMEDTQTPSSLNEPVKNNMLVLFRCLTEAVPTVAQLEGFFSYDYL